MLLELDVAEHMIMISRTPQTTDSRSSRAASFAGSGTLGFLFFAARAPLPRLSQRKIIIKARAVEHWKMGRGARLSPLPLQASCRASNNGGTTLLGLFGNRCQAVRMPLAKRKMGATRRESLSRSYGGKTSLTSDRKRAERDDLSAGKRLFSGVSCDSANQASEVRFCQVGAPATHTPVP